MNPPEVKNLLLADNLPQVGRLQYPASKNIRAEKDQPFFKARARINGGHIVSERNYPTNYRFENNVLYEKSEEGDGWNKYVECKN